MDCVCKEHPCSSSSPLAAPEISTPAAAKHKKRPWRRHPGFKGVRESNKKSRIWMETLPSRPAAAVADLSLLEDDAPINFPDSVARLQSTSLEDIPMAEGSDSGTVAGFVDEEAVFNMPALLDGMAEGMLLTPLGMKKGFRWSQYEVDDEEGIEFNLWEDLIL